MENGHISLMQAASVFGTEQAAIRFFEDMHWPDGNLACLRCGSTRAYRVEGRKPMPYRCRNCKRYFSLKTGTAMESSKLPLKKWAWAIYLEMTNLKGISTRKLGHDLEIRQATAWFMLHRIREGFRQMPGNFEGPSEVDETYIGGLERNKHAKKKLRAGRGPMGKTPVVGAKDRATNRVAARVVEDTTSETLNSFVDAHVSPEATVYTDGSSSYRNRRNHEAVHHSRGEYVRGDVHTNGVESFWATLKRAYKGTFHWLSTKHLQRYVNEFVARHNLRGTDTRERMRYAILGMVGRRLMYRDLVG